MEILQAPTDPTNVHGALKPQFIVIHDSGRSKYATDQQELSYLTKHKNIYVYHYYVFTTGEVYQLAPTDRMTYHVDGSMWQGKNYDFNPVSVGLAFGNTNMPDTVYSLASYNSMVALTAKLCLELGIPTTRVLGHKELSAYRGKTDPLAFDMDKFRSDVQNFLTTPKEPALFNYDDSRGPLVVTRIQGKDIKLEKAYYEGDDLVVLFSGDIKKAHARRAKQGEF